MSELNKRITTSFFLILIIFFSFLNFKLLSFFLFILTFFALVELHNMIKKIFRKHPFLQFIANDIWTMFFVCRTHPVNLVNFLLVPGEKSAKFL